MKDKLAQAFQRFKETREALTKAEIAVLEQEEKLKYEEAHAYMDIKERAQTAGEKLTQKELEERVRLAIVTEREVLKDLRADLKRAQNDYEIAIEYLKTLRALTNYYANREGEG